MCQRFGHLVCSCSMVVLVAQATSLLHKETHLSASKYDSCMYVPMRGGNTAIGCLVCGQQGAWHLGKGTVQADGLVVDLVSHSSEMDILLLLLIARIMSDRWLLSNDLFHAQTMANTRMVGTTMLSVERCVRITIRIFSQAAVSKSS